MAKIITSVLASFVTLTLLSTLAYSQRGLIEISNSAQIYKDLQKLQVVGSALYVAAHPDDENTRMISYLNNHLNLETTYLSLTRGDGGQNLIGTEIREELGVLRTQELLAARRVDGGNQRFSRSNDFGYSKNPEETLDIWDKEAVLSDIIWTIRLLKPDIIINRFSHDSGRRTHGHHTTSAMLSVEAFDMTAAPDIYPEHLEYTDPWQVSRLFFNTSWWFYGSRENFAKADKSQMVSVDIGSYDPITGLSNNEIAAHSRSQHRCQGFGRAIERGSQQDYCQLVKGTMPEDNTDLLEGLNLTWTRVEGGEQAALLMEEILEEYDFSAPYASIPKLIELRREINSLPDNPYSEIKTKALDNIIFRAAGLYQEAVSSMRYATRGETIGVDVNLVNRAFNRGVLVSRISIPNLGLDSLIRKPLIGNEPQLIEFVGVIPEDIQDRSPYWLREPGSMGMYVVEDPLQRGLPENPPVLEVIIEYTILGEDLVATIPVEYAEVDPAVGESYYPFDVLPKVTIQIQEEVYLFAGSESQKIKAAVSAHASGMTGRVIPQLEEGWKCIPEYIEFDLDQKGATTDLEFEIYPPDGQQSVQLGLQAEVADQQYDQSLTHIQYDHIPPQIILSKAETRLVKIDVKKEGERVGYIMGAGDKMPENLEQIGYQVDLLQQKDINPENIKGYDAIIVGIRALNTLDWLKYVNDDLLSYVQQGGTLIHQYNTNRRLKLEEFAPYPLRLSRDRVTREEAEVRILAPDHPAMNFPNKISAEDFEGWVQERGLYFPDEWAEEYTPILSSNDPGESPKDGGLLIARHGKGYFVYSGYSWFRELPAGVPGAFRIFANLTSLSHYQKP